VLCTPCVSQPAGLMAPIRPEVPGADPRPRHAYWRSWRPFWWSWPLALLLWLLVALSRDLLPTGPHRAPAIVLFPFAALCSVLSLSALALALFLQFPLYSLWIRYMARAGRLTVGVLILGVVHLVALACNAPPFWGPSLAEYLAETQSAAGSNALACGVVSLHEPSATAVSCANEALSGGRPFWVAFQVMGIDSTIYRALAGSSDGRYEQLNWDSDIYGGSTLVPRRTIWRRECLDPVVRVVNWESPISCSEERPGA